MKEAWFKNTPLDKREERIKQLQSYQQAFDELKKLLEENYRKKEAVREYAPGWEYKQIAVNEYNTVLDDIIKLLTVRN